MRIWSLHPKYLDSKGLVALWRETLLAKNVLEGKTRGYKNHPQLNRFKETSSPLDYINQYLLAVYDEAVNRGYRFREDKFKRAFILNKLTVTSGQLDYEWDHLLNKLIKRNKIHYNELMRVSIIEAHPIFKVVDGCIEDWEVLTEK